MRLKGKILTVPNVLTMLRMALIGVLVWLYAAGELTWALVVFLAAGLTDILDGFIARKLNLITDFGKLMDPLADKLMLIAALVCLVLDGRVPVWIVCAVAAKEIVMVVGGALMLRRGIVVHAQVVGKAAAGTFIAAVAAAFLWEGLAPEALLYLATALSLAALWYYVRAALRQVKKK